MTVQNDRFFAELQAFQPLGVEAFANLLQVNRGLALLSVGEFYYVSTPEEARKTEAIAYESGLKRPTWNYLKSDQELVQEYQVLLVNRLALLRVRHLSRQSQALRDSGRTEEARDLIRTAGVEPNF